MMSKQSAVQRQASLHHIACHDISDYELKHDFGFNIFGLPPLTSRHKGLTSNITIPNPPSPLLRASDGSPGTDLDPTPSTLYSHYPNPGCVAVVSIPSRAPPSIKPANNTPAAHLARGVRMDVPGGRAVAPRNAPLRSRYEDLNPLLYVLRCAQGPSAEGTTVHWKFCRCDGSRRRWQSV